MVNILNLIADYIIKQVQEESILSGFQYVVEYSGIEEKFSIIIEQDLKSKIVDVLLQREEVADVLLDNEGFDVVIYTNYAPNYIGDNEDD